jgi:hypothetical protein
VIGLRRSLSLRARKAQPAQLSLSAADLQSFPSAHSLHPLGIDLMPFAAQQRGHPPIPVSRMILAQAHDLFLEGSILSAHRAVAVITRSGQSKRSTGFRRRADPRFDYPLHRPSLG